MTNSARLSTDKPQLVMGRGADVHRSSFFKKKISKKKRNIVAKLSREASIWVRTGRLEEGRNHSGSVLIIGGLVVVDRL